MTDSDRNVFQNALSDFTFEAACGGAIRHLADSGCTLKQIMERLDYPISVERVRKALYKHLCDTGVILEESPEKGLHGAKPEYVVEYNSYGKPSYRRKYAADSEGNGADPGSAGTLGTVWKESVYKPVNAFSQPLSENKPEREQGYFGRGKQKREQGCFGRGKQKREQGYFSQGKQKREQGYFGQGRQKRVLGNSSRDDTESSIGYSGRGAELDRFLTGKCNLQKGEAAYLSCDFGIPDSPAAQAIALLNGRQREYLEGISWPRHRIYHRLDHRMKEILCSLYEQHAYEGICYFLSCKEKLYI